MILAMRLVFLDLYSFANSELCREKMSSLLYGKLSRTFILLLSTLHRRVTNLNRGPVNHATHERQGLTQHILSIPFLLEYSLLKNREQWRYVVHSLKKEKKECKINIPKKIIKKFLQSERSERHCSKSILFDFFYIRDMN